MMCLHFYRVAPSSQTYLQFSCGLATIQQFGIENYPSYKFGSLNSLGSGTHVKMISCQSIVRRSVRVSKARCTATYYYIINASLKLWEIKPISISSYVKISSLISPYASLNLSNFYLSTWHPM